MRGYGTALGVALGLALLVGSLGQADEMPVPTKLQVALFKKIFDYDRELQTKGRIDLVVLYDGPETAVTRELVAEFRALGVNARSLTASDLESSSGAVDVLYLSPGVDPSAVQDWCTSKTVLSVSGIPDLATTGKVAIGIGLDDKKPEILVHLRRVKAEGHELASSLLSLATVIR